MIAKHFQEIQQKEIRAEKEEGMKLKRIATSMAKMVKEFWNNIEKVCFYFIFHEKFFKAKVDDELIGIGRILIRILIGFMPLKHSCLKNCFWEENFIVLILGLNIFLLGSSIQAAKQIRRKKKESLRSSFELHRGSD